MIIEKILKQLTPERAKKEVEAIQKIELPPELQELVNGYEKVGDRNSLVWLLFFQYIKTVDFPPVAKKYQSSLMQAKFLLTIFLILLDDVADKTQNKRLMERLLRIPFGDNRLRLTGLSKKECSYLKFALFVWQGFFQLIKNYPRYRTFEDIFYFDIIQILNSMRFSFMVNNNPYLINSVEYWSYFPASQQLMAHRTLDLMCSPKFNVKELGLMRKIIWHSQQMLRIGNCLSTWQRESEEGDYSSDIFAYLVDEGMLNIETLINQDISINKKNIIQAENYFFKKWGEHYNYIKEMAPRVKCFNVKIFLSQLEKILILRLSVKNI